MTVGALVTLGETMGLFRPVEAGPGELTSDFRLSFGGAESNVAIGIARLGGEATWIGRVGADAVGRRIVRELRAEGVSVRAVEDAGAGTGVMIKEARLAGRTAVHYARSGSAGSRLGPADVDPDLVRDAAVVHVTGITPALSASAADAVDEIVRLARAGGDTRARRPLVSFDVNHRPSLWPLRDPSAVYRQLAAASDIVFAGEHEAELLVGAASPAVQAERIGSLGPRTVIVKRGRAGALVWADGAVIHRPAIPISPVDTVGAGDALVAGFLSATMRGLGPEEALELGIRTGAFACLGPGDWESFPRTDELPLLDEDEPVQR